MLIASHYQEYMLEDFILDAAADAVPVHSDVQHFGRGITILILGASLALVLRRFVLGDVLIWSATVFDVSLVLGAFQGQLPSWTTRSVELPTSAKRWWSKVVSCWGCVAGATAHAHSQPALVDLARACNAAAKNLAGVYASETRPSLHQRAQGKLLVYLLLLLLALGASTGTSGRLAVGVGALTLLLALPSICRRWPALLRAV